MLGAPPAGLKLDRMRPDEGFTIAYTVTNEAGLKVGVLQREEKSGSWWIQVGENEYSEGFSCYTRREALNDLHKLWLKASNPK